MEKKKPAIGGAEAGPQTHLSSFREDGFGLRGKIKAARLGTTG
jgi:hypothetical protein